MSLRENVNREVYESLDGVSMIYSEFLSEYKDVLGPEVEEFIPNLIKNHPDEFNEEGLVVTSDHEYIVYPHEGEHVFIDYLDNYSDYKQLSTYDKHGFERQTFYLSPDDYTPSRDSYVYTAIVDFDNYVDEKDLSPQERQNFFKETFKSIDFSEVNFEWVNKPFFYQAYFDAIYNAILESLGFELIETFTKYELELLEYLREFYDALGDGNGDSKLQTLEEIVSRNPYEWDEDDLEEVMLNRYLEGSGETLESEFEYLQLQYHSKYLSFTTVGDFLKNKIRTIIDDVSWSFDEGSKTRIELLEGGVYELEILRDEFSHVHIDDLLVIDHEKEPEYIEWVDWYSPKNPYYVFAHNKL